MSARRYELQIVMKCKSWITRPKFNIKRQHIGPRRYNNLFFNIKKSTMWHNGLPLFKFYTKDVWRMIYIITACVFILFILSVRIVQMRFFISSQPNLFTTNKAPRGRIKLLKYRLIQVNVQTPGIPYLSSYSDRFMKTNPGNQNCQIRRRLK